MHHEYGRLTPATAGFCHLYLSCASSWWYRPESSLTSFDLIFVGIPSFWFCLDPLYCVTVFKLLILSCCVKCYRNSKRCGNDSGAVSESSPGLCDKSSTALGSLRPLDQTDLIRLSHGSTCSDYIRHGHLLLVLSLKPDTHVTVPRKAEG